eukprot:9788630-Alexandrium_andersonii.AAC.1
MGKWPVEQPPEQVFKQKWLPSLCHQREVFADCVLLFPAVDASPSAYLFLFAKKSPQFARFARLLPAEHFPALLSPSQLGVSEQGDRHWLHNFQVDWLATVHSKELPDASLSEVMVVPDAIYLEGSLLVADSPPCSMAAFLQRFPGKKAPAASKPEAPP